MPANDERIASLIPSKVTYLEMLKPPRQPSQLTLISGVSIKRQRDWTLSDYRRLYSQIGGPYHWADRILMPDGELSLILSDANVKIYVLYFSSQTAGYIELNYRTRGEVEISYFGILRNYHGKGLGAALLGFALEQAWSHSPQRVWLHTCEQDDPKAIAFYQKHGFEIYKTEMDEAKILKPE